MLILLGLLNMNEYKTASCQKWKNHSGKGPDLESWDEVIIKNINKIELKTFR